MKDKPQRVSRKTARLFYFISPILATLGSSVVTLLGQFMLLKHEKDPEVDFAISTVFFMISHWFFMAAIVSVYPDDEFQSKRLFLGFNWPHLSWWMLAFIFIHPIALGASLVSSVRVCVPKHWFLASFFMGLINGPLEEYFWRYYLEKVGKDAGFGKNLRLLLSSAFFSLWHLAWCYFGFPQDKFLRAAVASLVATFIFGSVWCKIQQAHPDNYFAIGFHHALFNFLVIFPAQINTALNLPCQANPDFFGNRE
jgi:hypothetical protein